MKDIISVGILLYTLASNLLISAFVYKNNPRSATGRVFGVLGILISLWLIVLYITQDPSFIDSNLFWVRVSIFLAAPMSTTFFLFAHTVPHNKLELSKRKFFAILAVTAIVMMVNISPYTFTGVEIVQGLPQPLVGPGMLPFSVLSTFFSIAAVYILFKKSLFSSGREKEQFKFITIGILLMLGLIIGTVLVPVIFFNTTTFVTLTPLYTILFLGMTAYAIIRHRFLDIRLILGRAIAFFIFILLCAGSYTFILFVLLQKILRLQIDFLTAGIALVLAVFSAITFQPLLGWLRHITNVIFFKGHYESNKLLGELTHIMTQTIDLQYMTTSILNLLVKEMRLTKAAFLIIDKDKIADVVSIKYGKNELATTTLEQLFTKYLKAHPNFIFEDLPEGKLKKLFRKYDISIAITIKVEHAHVAVLILGHKLSGEIYNTEDINLLNIFASESGIAIQHAKAYEQIMKFNVVLEKKVAERTRSLQTQNKKVHAQNLEIRELLGEKTKLLAQQSDFLALAAHELRTPLAIALLRTDDMLSKNKEKGMEEDLEAMDKILKKLKDLMDKLFDVFQHDLSKINITTERLNVYEFVERIHQDFGPLMSEKKLSFSLNNKVARRLMADIDPIYMRQLMQNLLVNAIKFTPVEGKITLSAKEDKTSFTFCISDNGEGVPEKTRDTIFEKFTSNHTMQSPGIGLGLYVCKRIAELHGGKIWVENNPGGGAVFCVQIPKKSGIRISDA